MSLILKVQDDLKQAMRDKNTEKILVLRSILAGIKNKSIEIGKELTDEEVLDVFKKEAKKRDEAIVMYKKARREELVERETSELQLIKAYLPEMMSMDQVKEELIKIKEAGELTDDFGTSMRVAMEKLKGKADGGVIAGALKQVL